MGWRNIIGAILESFDKPVVLGSAETPFNYAMQASFSPGASGPVTTEQVQAVFPAVSQQEAAAELHRATTLGRQALDLYYQVRDGHLTEAAAEAQIKAACPDLSPANFNLLQARCRVAVSK